jgi:uncharacterized protein YdaU (DUF1376 family)
MNDEKVLAMTNEQFGVYMRLLYRAWFSDVPASLPSNDAALAAMVGMDASSWGAIKSVVLSPFRLKDGRYHQKKMRQVYDAVLAKLKAKSDGGIKGAKKRWGDRLPIGDPLAKQWDTSSNRIGIEEEVQKNTLSIRARAEAKIPSEKEFVAAFMVDAIPEDYLRKKWLYFDADAGWLNGQGRLRDWGRLVRGWWATDRQSLAKTKRRGGEIPPDPNGKF